MASKVVFITGGNAGLGKEIIKSLLKLSAYHIFLGSRSVEKGEEAKAALLKETSATQSKIDVVQVDIASDQSIEACAQQLSNKTQHIDILVNNSGVSLDMAVGKGMSKREAFNQMFDVNVTGTHLMTEAVMPLLIKSNDPRLLFITSGTSSLQEAAEGKPPTAPKYPAGWPKPPLFSFTGYRSSKAALNMLLIEWTRILKEDKVKIFAVSPGFLATGLAGVGPEQLRKMGAQEPSTGANFVTEVIEGKRDDQAGHVVHKEQGIVPW